MLSKVSRKHCNFLDHTKVKTVIGEVVVIPRIIKVKVILTETLIILDVTKTESNNCFIIHSTKEKKSCFCFFTDGKHHKARELDTITLRNHATWS